MRVKTLVTLPSKLLEKIDQLDSSRSAFLERAALSYLAVREKSARDAKDVAILSQISEELNEQSDALEFQRLPK